MMPSIRTAFTLATLLAATTLAAQTPNTLTKQEAAHGWKLLWDGKTTDGWRSTHTDPTFPTIGWTVNDGTITIHPSGNNEPGKGGDIITTQQYTNFELTAEFRITRGANSGIKYFVQPMSRPGSTSQSYIGFEYQVIDDDVHPDAKLGKDGDRTTASLYDVLPAAKDKPTKPVGEWNTVRIVVRGNHGEQWLNDKKVLEYDRSSPVFLQAVADSKFKPFPDFGKLNQGHILLQDHGSEVSFRNLKIHELP